jgi:hypothetical protein
MAQLIHEHLTHVVTAEGERFTARTYGEPDGNGVWQGWLEFVPTDTRAPVLRTERETTQPSRQALEYWAEGLEPIYFEGAFARARVISTR